METEPENPTSWSFPGPFDRPFDKLTALSFIEGLTGESNTLVIPRLDRGIQLFLIYDD